MKTQEIADLLKSPLVGDPDIEIHGVAALSTASTGEIAFMDSSAESPVSNASCLIVPVDFSAVTTTPYISTDDPKLAFSLVAAVLHPPKTRRPEIHSSAVIADNASVGQDVFIGAYVCVGENSVIGDGAELRAGAKIGDSVRVGSRTVIHPNVFIEDGCTIGDNVIIHAGSVIGADGFGYVRGEHGHSKFPQIGTVVIEDNVEIGANTCIDRGALGETRIGEGTKIDNLVQIAHNVQIGKRVIIVALTGISGSVVIGDDVILAGQVGIADHVTIRSGAVIGAKSAVFPNKIVRPGVWAGIPVRPVREFARQDADLKSLGRLKAEVKQLRDEIAKLRDTK